MTCYVLLFAWYRDNVSWCGTRLPWTCDPSASHPSCSNYKCLLHASVKYTLVASFSISDIKIEMGLVATISDDNQKPYKLKLSSQAWILEHFSTCDVEHFDLSVWTIGHFEHLFSSLSIIFISFLKLFIYNPTLYSFYIIAPYFYDYFSILNVHTVLVWFSISMIKNMSKSDLEWKGFIFLYSPSWRGVKAGTWRQELKQMQWKYATYRLAPPSFLAHFAF